MHEYSRATATHSTLNPELPFRDELKAEGIWDEL